MSEFDAGASSSTSDSESEAGLPMTQMNRKREEEVAAGKKKKDHADDDDDEVVDPVDEELAAVVSKYAKIHQPVPFSKQSPKLRINLEWRNIDYKVVYPMPPSNFFVKLLFRLPIPATITTMLKKKREIPILNRVSGSTTLLNVLARRIKSNLTGEVLVNGEEVSGRRFKRRMAYVLQDDIFFPSITVRDTVTDAAYLKLPKSMSLKEKRAKVDDVLSELGLERCSGTIVGGGWVRGVSGGERKRTNIATEIISNPSLVFLDEPTSGLDAATSLGLIVSLKTLAKSGHTVVTTIHQPSSAMFMMFDKVLLLAEGGWVVYSGSAAGVLPYFASLGLDAPLQYNPADFMLEVVSSTEKVKDGRTVRQMLIDTYGENEKKREAEQNNEGMREEKEQEKEEEAKSLEDMKHGDKFVTPFWLQTWVLTKRTFKQRRHDILSWDRIIQILFIAVLSGLLWLQMDKDEESLGDRVGFLFFTTMFWVMTTWFNALFAFPPERAVLTKERSTGTYRLSAYFVGKVLAETPLELVMPILFSVITYWMVGLADDGGSFVFFVVIMCLFVLMGSGIGLLIGAIMVDVKKALTLSTIVVLGSVLLGGFFISQNNLKVWIAWARWISFMKYCYELVLLNEFKVGNETFAPAPISAYGPDVQEITGQDVLDHLNVETYIWADIIFVVGVIVVSRVMAYLSLRYLNKPKR
ncbi:ABC2 type transporter superfamily protein [Acanthamoeba castellanii str. Neff]|uniref:ABC2 type transporter superfamily protein n=1 Tax=Acanthamoeba castellanii (strain ATCC 30010 / Neff) TaxID=1257118 RepID=L8GFB9_ACACF|nr:ABC2 type transporter superfamily protein [Acanthamoeba castellanii str. Neff]ELR11672.1 ABC2 type transporter superfamily protein [Acanthamoeba castellanii str. Neff]